MTWGKPTPKMTYMTNATRKPTTSYTTEAGNVLTATRASLAERKGLFSSINGEYV